MLTCLETSDVSRVKDIFSSDPIGFSNLLMSNGKHFAGNRRKVGVEIRLKTTLVKMMIQGSAKNL